MGELFLSVGLRFSRYRIVYALVFTVLFFSGWTFQPLYGWSQNTHRLIAKRAWHLLVDDPGVPESLLLGAVAPDRHGKPGAIPTNAHIWEPRSGRGSAPRAIGILWRRIVDANINSPNNGRQDPALLFEMGRVSHLVADICQPMHTVRHPGEKRWHQRWERTLDRRIKKGSWVPRVDFSISASAANIRKKTSSISSQRINLPHDEREVERLVRVLGRQSRELVEALMDNLEAGDFGVTDGLAEKQISKAVYFTKLIWKSALQGKPKGATPPWELSIFLLWFVAALGAPPLGKLPE